MRWIFVLGLVGLIGCVPTVEQGPVTRPAPQQAAPQPPATPTRAKVQQFMTVVQRVEPIAERECRARAPRSNCDFRIVVDDRPGQPVNAYQTLDRSGRPILAFTLPMIASVRNADELAFILGHEAAHHIAGHIPQSQQRAAEGALLGGLLATLGGFDAQGVDTVTRLGATVGARRFSKDFELEADAIGTVIAAQAGFDPVRGAEFFTRSPDP